MNSKTDILFIYPPTGWDKEAMHIAENDAPPLGLLYVAAAARAAGMKVAILDMNHPRLDESGLAKHIAKNPPALIAFSTLTTGAPQTKRLVAMLKGRFPAIPLIAGGIHPTVLPLDMLNAGVDYVVQGEGESTIVELARALLDQRAVEEVPGIAFPPPAASTAARGRSKTATPAFVQTASRPPEPDLDILPLPARDLVTIQDYGQSGALCSTRGCPNACSFCSSVLANGHKYRQRSIAKVREEMDQMNASNGIQHFQFLDDNFTADPDRAAALAASVLDRGFIWSCQTTVMELAEKLDVLDLMFASGCREIYFGLETGSRRLLRECKGIELDAAMTVLTHAASLQNGRAGSKFNRLQTVVGFIVGHPEDDEQSIEETVQLALKLRRLGIDTMLSILQPYPGSMIHRSPGKYGVTIESNEYAQYLYPKANISTRHLKRDRIRELYASGLLRIMQTYNK